MIAARARAPRVPFFERKDGTLHIEEVDLHAIAEAVGTPTYVYSGAAIDDAYAAIDRAIGFAERRVIAYATKANDGLAILSRLARLGSGADIVSAGELARASKAGIPPERIVFSGVGKRDDEIEAALRAGIRAIHVESAEELAAIDAVATRLDQRARIGLRVNPNVDAATHPYIATGLHESKFGLELDVARMLLPKILGSRRLSLESVACHIGSQLSQAAPLRDAIAILAKFASECISAGAPVRTLDAGGGFPLSYGDEDTAYPPAHAFGEAIREGIERGGASKLGLELLVEPGRAIVGGAGVLLTRVLYVKERAGKRFVIVDAAMTELIRPALYGAHHPIVPVDDRPGPLSAADVVGPVCETGDFLARDRPLPRLARGDLVAIHNVGAYGRTMESRYNARLRAAEVMVDGRAHRVVRDRETVEDLFRGERP